jgi:hypothetical protein
VLKIFYMKRCNAAALCIQAHTRRAIANHWLPLWLPVTQNARHYLSRYFDRAAMLDNLSMYFATVSLEEVD